MQPLAETEGVHSPPCLFPGTVLDHLVGEETLADYLLYTLNRHQLFG